MIRYMVVFLLSVLLAPVLLGCAAHRPVVPMPDSASPIGWREYYADQFKAFGDKVQPPEENASLEQRVGYADAKSAYDRKKTIGTVVGICALGCSVILFIQTLSQAASLK